MVFYPHLHHQTPFSFNNTLHLTGVVRNSGVTPAEVKTLRLQEVLSGPEALLRCFIYLYLQVWFSPALKRRDEGFDLGKTCALSM